MLHTPAAAKTAELTGKQMFLLFPTPMFTGMLPDLSLCDRAERVIRDLRKKAAKAARRLPERPLPI